MARRMTLAQSQDVPAPAEGIGLAVEGAIELGGFQHARLCPPSPAPHESRSRVESSQSSRVESSY